MRLSLVTTVLLLMLSFTSWSHAAEATFLQQAQAADLMSGLLTYYGDLTTARMDSMRSYLQQIGKLQDYEAHKPQVPPTKGVVFADAFRGAVLFVQQHDARLADGTLAKMPEPQLQQEFGAIQRYNLGQFLDLQGKREEIDRMKAYLDQIGRFPDYMAWAQKNLDLPAAPSTRPVNQSVQAYADWIAEQAGDIKAQAWQRAQAKGMSQQDFEKQWQQKLLDLRKRVASRVEQIRALATGLQGDSGQGGPGAEPAAANLSPAQQTPRAFAAAPSSPQDPRWQPYYYGPDRQFNSWGDAYPDVYKPSVNGGVFRSYDLRLNQDYDARVNGEVDRRENTSGDRRLDFRVDPRVNY